MVPLLAMSDGSNCVRVSVVWFIDSQIYDVSGSITTPIQSQEFVGHSDSVNSMVLINVGFSVWPTSRTTLSLLFQAIIS